MDWSGAGSRQPAADSERRVVSGNKSINPRCTSQHVTHLPSGRRQHLCVTHGSDAILAPIFRLQNQQKEAMMDSQPCGHVPAVSPEAPIPTAHLARPAEIRRRETGELLRRVQAGERAALDQIVERLTPLMWNVARAQGLDKESASDVVQVTWVKLLENIHRIRSPEALISWLVTVTRHNAYATRTAQRRIELVDPHDLTDEPDPAAGLDTDLVKSEQYRCLWENLQKLPPTCQELLRILAFTGQTSYCTVSNVLDMPKGSIGPTRSRCLNKLKILLRHDPRWDSE
jgi:RNA polymerase sigma factor (sigma-70 family)